MPKKVKADMPSFGTLRGKRVELDGIEARLSQADLEQVVVDVPGQGEIRPWRFAPKGPQEIKRVKGRIVL